MYNDEIFIIGKPPILLHSKDSGKSWERVPLSPKVRYALIRFAAAWRVSPRIGHMINTCQLPAMHLFASLQIHSRTLEIFFTCFCVRFTMTLRIMLHRLLL